jgi:hypothetical protein
MITVDIIRLFLLRVEHKSLDEETVREHIIVNELQVRHTLLHGLNQEVQPTILIHIYEGDELSSVFRDICNLAYSTR